MTEQIIAVNSNCYHGYSIEDAIRGTAAAGFRFMELTATKGWTEHVFPNMPFERLLEIKDLLEEYGVKPFAMSGHTNLADPDRVGDFIRNMRLAAFFGCDYIVSSIGEAHLADQTTADIPTVARCVAALVPHLKKYGLTLVLETHGHEHGTGKVLHEVVSLVNSPFVKVNYDTANVIFYGRVKPEADILNCMDTLGYVHLKDKRGADDVWDFPALGQGNVNFPSIFQSLKKAGNTSPFSIEIEFTPEGAGSLEAVNKAVRESAEYLISQGFKL